MRRLSVSDVERRSGLEKRSDETVGEYLTRVGERAGLSPETVRPVVDHVNRERFGPASARSDTPDAPVEEYLRAVDSIDGGAGLDDVEDDPDPSADPGDPTGTRSEEQVPPVSGPLGQPPEDDGGGVRRVALLLVAVVLLGGVVAGGAVLMTGDLLPASEEAPADEVTPADDDTEADDTGEAEDDREPIDIGSDDDADEPTVVDSAEEAAGALEVTELLVDGDDPDEEFVELTNTGDVALDMSDWTVRDREGDGVVDDRGLDPVTFPDGFVLEPGESVRIVTAPGEDTEDTVHWGYVDRQNWRADGDVIRVLDGDGETVLRHEYGTLPE